MTATATDAAGNTSAASSGLNITVDTTDPTAVCQNYTAQLDINGMVTIAPGDVNNGSSDANGIADLSLDVTDFDCGDVGLVDSALNFDRPAAPYNGVRTDANANIPIGTSPRTFTLWVNPDAGAGNTGIGVLMHQGNGDCTGLMFGMGIGGGNELLFWGGCQDYGSSLIMPNNTWSHVAVTYDGTTNPNNFTLYVNGVPESFSINLASGGTTASRLFMGIETVDNGASYRNQFDGQLDEAKVFDRVLTPAEIADDMNGNNPALGNLVAYFPFSEGSGTTTADVVGGNDATLIGMTAGDWVTGPPGLGLAPVTLTVTDTAGNQDFCTAQITVEDNVAPTAICQNITVNLPPSQTVSITPGDVNNGSSDACGIDTLSIDVDTFTCANLGGNTVVLTVTDIHGNSSTCNATVTVQDIVAPPAPSITAWAVDTGSSNSDNITNDSVLTVSGTAEINSTVEIFASGVGLVGTTSANGAGAWGPINLSALTDGFYNITAVATDCALNSSVASASLDVTIDLTAPAAPSVPDMNAASDSGTSNTDDLTNDNTPQFDGTAEPGALVQIYVDTILQPDTDTADGGGNWSITLTGALADGGHNITVRQTDVAGNVGPQSAALPIVIDTTAPAPPTQPDLNPASDSGASNTDNITNDTTPEFNGSAEAGSTVQIFANAVGVGSSLVPGSGNWSVTTSVLTNGVKSITARATDPAGNTSAASTALNVTIDTVGPAMTVPDLNAGHDSGASNTDNITNVNTPLFLGIAEANVPVELLDGGTPVATGVSAGSGFWSLTPGVGLSDGPHNIQGRATDTAGNVTTTGILVVTIDTVAPTTSNADLQAASDSGSSNSDNYTNDNTPTFDGTTTESGAAVELRQGATLLASGTAVGNNWTLTSSALAEGTFNVFARSYDIAGNFGDSPVPLPVTIDTLAPTVSVPDMQAASDSGASNSDDYTSDSTPTFDGTASEPNVTVQLFVDTIGNNQNTFAPTNWTLTPTALADGPHNIQAQGTDLAGNVGALSAALPITIDTIAPAAPSTPDLNAASDSGTSNTDNITNDNTPQFDGTAEANSTVQIFVNGVGNNTGTATGGNYAITTTTITDGNRNIRARATDLAGNTSGLSGTLVVTIDTVAPVAPSVPDLNPASDSGALNTDNITNDNTPTFDGTSEVNAIVELFANVTSLGTTTASGGGVWTFTVGAPAPDGTYSISARQTDVAGNTGPSSAGLSVTIDTVTNVSNPDLDPASDSGLSNSDDNTNDNTPTFNGTGEVGATVTLRANGNPVGTGLVNGGGNWTITSSLLADGIYTMTTSILDIAGNTANSPGSLVVEIDTVTFANQPNLITADDSGYSSTDNYTNVQMPTFDGTAEDTSAIEVISSIDGTLGFTSTNGVGFWSFSTLGNLTEGVHQIRVRVTDIAGNTLLSPALTVVIDITDPAQACGGELMVVGPSITSATVVDFSVLFTEPVIFFDTPELTIAGPGNLDSVSPGVGSQPASSYTIQVSATGTGDITVGWVTPSAIEDRAGNFFNPPTSPPGDEDTVTIVDISATQVGTRQASADGANQDYYGTSVSINGEVAFIGAPRDDDNGTQSGSVYVYERDDTSSWVLVAKLTPSVSGAYFFFGEAVDVYGDWAIVGAPYEDEFLPDDGAAYVFHRENGVWTEFQRLAPATREIYYRFGAAVAVAGNSIAVAAPFDATTRRGRVYMYEYDSCTDTWNEAAILQSTDIFNEDQFGAAVDLTISNGIPYLAVGVRRDDDAGADTGAVYVYRRVSGLWSNVNEAKLLPGDATRTDFVGTSVSIDGNLLVVGAPGHDDTAVNTGAAYLFERSGLNTWTQIDKMVAPDRVANDNFGNAVGISNNNIAIGSPQDDDDGLDSGSVYVFEYTGGSTNFIQKLLAEEGDRQDRYGDSIGVSLESVLSGSRLGNNFPSTGSNPGTAYFYRLDQP